MYAKRRDPPKVGFVIRRDPLKTGGFLMTAGQDVKNVCQKEGPVEDGKISYDDGFLMT